MWLVSAGTEALEPWPTLREIMVPAATTMPATRLELKKARVLAMPTAAMSTSSCSRATYVSVRMSVRKIASRLSALVNAITRTWWVNEPWVNVAGCFILGVTARVGATVRYQDNVGCEEFNGKAA